MIERRVESRRLRAAVVVVVVAVAALASIVHVGTASAQPGRGGYYWVDSAWAYGPTEAKVDGDHTAYTGGDPGSLTSFGGAYGVETNVPDGTSWPQPQPWSQYYPIQLLSREVAVFGITGGEARMSNNSTLVVACVSPDRPDGRCSVPGGEYAIHLEWEFRGRDAACYALWRQNLTEDWRLDVACPWQIIEGSDVRRVVAGNPLAGSTTTTQPAQEPSALFLVNPSSEDPFAFSFDNRSTDYEDDPEDLAYLWDFGDEATSTEQHPSHRYERAGRYDVTLTVTDSDGFTDEATEEVTVANGLVVNSTGDDPAEDPEELGCDTGALVDDVPECTLRAAVEASEAAGGGEITFAVEGGGTPTIALGSALPPITRPSVVDGTTQEGGWVEVVGGGEAGLAIAGGTTRVTGLVLSGATIGIDITGGSSHTIEGNHLGTNAAATEAGDTDFGVAVTDAAGVVVQGNVTGATVGLIAAPGSDGLEVTDNLLGVGPDGSTPLGEPRGGAILGGASTVSGNVARGSSGGILVLGAGAAGTTITDNHVGVDAAGAQAYESTGYGIRVDGAPGVTIGDNHVASANAYGSIVVSGSRQYTTSASGEIELGSPADEPAAGSVTGGSATITGNTVGIAGGAAVEDAAAQGIVTWAGAASSTVEGNTVAGTTGAAVELTGGAGHRVVGNTLGSAASPVGSGVALDATTGAVVGGVGAGVNTITSSHGGVVVLDEAATTRIESNRITAAADAEDHIGIGVAPEATGTTIVGNAVTGGTTGVEGAGEGLSITGTTVEGAATGIVSSAEGASITGNAVTGAEELGIGSTGDGATVSMNVVRGGGAGIELAGAELTVAGNRVGVADGSDTVVGNEGTGIAVTEGDATLTRNVVAGSGDHGIEVGSGAEAELRANRVWDSADTPIAVADGPDAPVLAAAVLSEPGAAVRTTLLLTDLPAGDAGTIEVFANPSCGPDGGEARHLMEITRVKEADETSRIIQVIGAVSRDHFTVTYTDAEGRTSELSGCTSESNPPDTDGDGSVDPFDEVMGGGGDPTAAVLATDEEQLVYLRLAPYDEETKEGGGTFEAVKVVEDPDPSSHPAGWDLPYGAISFRITGVAAGARTRLTMASVFGDDMTAGSTYWKHGPPRPGAAPRWYPFVYDTITETGAYPISGVQLPGVGLRNAFLIELVDGGRGDSDGGANTTITDPGGPVRGVAAGPVQAPVDAPTDPPVVAPIDPPAVGPGGGPTPGAGVVPPPSANRGGGLARTGSDLAAGLRAGLLLLLAGVVLVLARRHRLTRL